MTPQWWDWHAAVRKNAPTPGALATAMIWAGVCWDWRRDKDDSERSTAVRLTDLPEHFPYSVGFSTLKEHFAALVKADLLTVIGVNAPGQAKRYAPVIPGHMAGQAALFAGNTASQAAVSEDNRADEAAEQGWSGSRPPFSPEVPDPPSHAHTHAYAREDSPTRGANEEIGATAYAVLCAELDARHGTGQSSRIAPGFKQRLIRTLGGLRAAGWPEHVLVERIAGGNLHGVAKVGAVLCSRADELVQLEPPETAAARRDRLHAAQAPLRTGETATEASAAAREAARAAVRAARAGPDGLVPAGFTPSLFTEGEPA